MYRHVFQQTLPILSSLGICASSRQARGKVQQHVMPNGRQQRLIDGVDDLQKRAWALRFDLGM